MREQRCRYNVFGDKIIEYCDYKFIKEEKWHNPSRMAKFVRTINKIVLMLILMLLLIYIWDSYVSGKSVILSICIIFNPLFLIIGINLLNEISKNIEVASEDTMGIKVEEDVYIEYIRHIRDSKWIPIATIIFLLFICLLTLDVSMGKFEFDELRHLWINHEDNCFFALLAISGIIMAFINAFFFKTLHYKLDYKLWRKIYYQ